jgi:hypothetical protein
MTSQCNAVQEGYAALMLWPNGGQEKLRFKDDEARRVALGGALLTVSHVSERSAMRCFVSADARVYDEPFNQWSQFLSRRGFDVGHEGLFGKVILSWCNNKGEPCDVSRALLYAVQHYFQTHFKLSCVVQAE